MFLQSYIRIIISCIRECRVFRDGQETFEFTVVSISRIYNDQRSYKPETKHTDRMILPSKNTY